MIKENNNLELNPLAVGGNTKRFVTVCNVAVFEGTAPNELVELWTGGDPNFIPSLAWH